MKSIALIPARYATTRFRGKLMAELKGKTVIRHTYEATLATGLFDEVIVATDSETIFREITSHGGKAVMTTGNHESGTDRIAEAARDLNADVIVNVQGDTPFVKKEPLQQLLQQFEDPIVQVGSLMQVLEVLVRPSLPCTVRPPPGESLADCTSPTAAAPTKGMGASVRGTLPRSITGSLPDTWSVAVPGGALIALKADTGSCLQHTGSPCLSGTWK